MADYSTGSRFRELVLQLPVEKWQVLSVRGVGDGAPRDHRDVGGGFSYSQQDASGKRFLVWRIVNQYVELVEDSLDADLRKRHLRIQLQGGGAIGSVEVVETASAVAVFFSSSSVIYELLLPHPSRLSGQQSVLADASSQNIRSHTLTLTSGPAVANCFKLEDDDTVICALPNSTGGTYAVRWPRYGAPVQHELKQSSIIQKLWTGFRPATVRSLGTDSAGCPADGAIAASILSLDGSMYVYTLCRDCKVRIWSWQTRDCVATHDLASFSADRFLSTKGVSPKLRTYGDAESGLTYLAVHVTGGASSKQFCILEPSVEGGKHNLSHVTTLYGGLDDDELTDFCVSSDCIWALWSDKLGRPSLRRAPFGGRKEVWTETLLANTAWSEDEASPIDLEGRDPREAYVEYIFHPNRFSLLAISKAVQIFDKNKLDVSSGNTISGASLTLSKLQVAATVAVQRKVRETAGEGQLADEDYYELQLSTWMKFFSYVLQYHEKAMQPLGLLLSSSGTVCLVRYDSTSFLGTCDCVDLLYHFPTDSAFAEVLEGGGDDETVATRDVQIVAECLAALRACFPDVGSFFASGLLRQVSSAAVVLPTLARQAVTALLQQQADTLGSHSAGTATLLLREVSSRLQNVRNVLTAFEAIAKILDMSLSHGFKAAPSSIDGDDDDDDVGHRSRSGASGRCTFASTSGRRLLACALEAAASTRWLTCCECLVLIAYIQRHAEQAGVHHVTVGRLEASMAKLGQLACSLYSVVWLSRTVNSSSMAVGMDLDAPKDQLDALSLADRSSFLSGNASTTGSSRSAPPHQHLKDQSAGEVTLLELFVLTACRASQAGQRHSEDSPAKRRNSSECDALAGAVVECARLAWPIAARPVVAECLATLGQFEALQQHCRLLSGWCRQNMHSRCFLLARSYLAHNELLKALDSFVAAVPGLETELFLREVLLEGCNCNDDGHLEVQYYVRVIALLEQLSCAQLIIQVARQAVSAAKAAETRGNDSVDLQDAAAMLYTKIFKHELELAHHDEAFEALVSNTDGDRKRDCLRQFVVTLCERGCIRELISYSYADLHDEVVRILESKARSVDLSVQSYYEILYSFHVHHSNYRRAGTMMYEQAVRLALELPGLASLQRQAKCLLSAMNALRLVSLDYAWIVKPSLSLPAADADRPGRSPKRTSADELLPAYDRPRLVAILELKDLEREYALLSSRLKLIQREPAAGHTQGPTLAAPETAALLVKAGMFDDAVRLCQKFDLKLTSVFEGLTYRCVQLTTSPRLNVDSGKGKVEDAGDWLAACNELPVEHSNISVVDQAWSLLRQYLATYEEDSLYHRCVATKLLSLCFTLPDWLVASYKALNSPELLRLLLRHGLLEEAALFTMEYIDAVLGVGYESFGLPTFMQGTLNPCSVWLPYTAIDQLIGALQTCPDNVHLQQSHEALQGRLSVYRERLASVSEGVARLAVQRKVVGSRTANPSSARAAVEAAR